MPLASAPSCELIRSMRIAHVRCSWFCRQLPERMHGRAKSTRSLSARAVRVGARKCLTQDLQPFTFSDLGLGRAVCEDMPLMVPGSVAEGDGSRWSLSLRPDRNPIWLEKHLR